MDLVGGTDHPNSARAITHLINYATANPDGYVAQAILAHPIEACLSARDRQNIHETRNTSALDQNLTPDFISIELLKALQVLHSEVLV